MLRALLLLGATAVAFCAACARVAPALMPFHEYAQRSYSFPYVVRVQAPTGELLYFGAAHSNDWSHPQLSEMQRLWAALRPTAAFHEGGAVPIFDTAEESVSRYGETALVLWLARRDNVPVQTLEPSKAEIVAALSKDFSPEHIKVATVLRQISQSMRRPAQYRAASADVEVERILAVMLGIPGLNGQPTTLEAFARMSNEMVPFGSWRSPSPEWFDPVPEPAPTWLNAFARAESNFRDEATMERLTRAVRKGERVFAVVGGTHVVMQERTLRWQLTRR